MVCMPPTLEALSHTDRHATADDATSNISYFTSRWLPSDLLDADDQVNVRFRDDKGILLPPEREPDAVMLRILSLPREVTRSQFCEKFLPNIVTLKVQLKGGCANVIVPVDQAKAAILGLQINGESHGMRLGDAEYIWECLKPSGPRGSSKDMGLVARRRVVQGPIAEAIVALNAAVILL
tara:strand:+ start:2575 stop:3114 length:540 start_codon:yes stop_codon:yes gene_type:complete